MYAHGVASTGRAKRSPGRPPEGVREAILETTLRLISELGLARLTTKEIARASGCSEASIYYYFVDKAALVEAVILDGVLAPFQAFAAEFAQRASAGPVLPRLLEFAEGLTSFWENVLPLISAVQSDAELRRRFQQRVNGLDLGPHRGVGRVSAALAGLQEAGRLRADVDPTRIAMLVCSTCYLTGYQRHMLGPGARRKLPSLAATVSELVRLLEP